MLHVLFKRPTDPPEFITCMVFKKVQKEIVKKVPVLSLIVYCTGFKNVECRNQTIVCVIFNL